LLAGLAAVTERVQLGPLVAALPFHNPAVLAKTAATIDEISGGRLVFGVGAGWNRFEFDAFGLPFDRRVSRFGEAFTIIRRLLAGEQFEFAGEFYTLRESELVPKPRPGGPPLMIGSSSPRMLGLTLPHVAWWNAWHEDFDNDPSRVAPLLARIDGACRSAGRDPAAVAKTLAVFIGFEDRPPARRTNGEPWRGTVDDQVERLRVLAEAGVAEVQAVLDPITAATVEKLAEIASRFRGV
jgi:alkanesulfonate monooxygenase SsuD/methylene tetrahydromethanopterin reductase-like flavin-dependent oxidoreductase (luciferase family)